MQNKEKLIEKIKPIEIYKPSDIIIRQIRELISSGVIKPGERLPAERELAERFGIGRGYIREALKKLEFYGIVKTLPQSGTVVANLGISLIEGLMNNIVTVEADNFPMLIETRRILEINTASLAALKATDDDIDALKDLLEKYREKAQKGENALSEDLLFHLKIADISKNSILKSLIMIITPEVQRQSQQLNTCKDDRPRYALAEHEAIFESIKSREPEKAAEAMAFHMGKTAARV